MAHHKSAKKRIRQDLLRKLRNRFYKKTTRTSIKNLRAMSEKEAAEQFLPKVLSMVDRLAKRGTWHKNKAANLKSSLMRHAGRLA